MFCFKIIRLNIAYARSQWSYFVVCNISTRYHYIPHSVLFTTLTCWICFLLGWGGIIGNITKYNFVGRSQSFKIKIQFNFDLFRLMQIMTNSNKIYLHKTLFYSYQLFVFKQKKTIIYPENDQDSKVEIKREKCFMDWTLGGTGDQLYCQLQAKEDESLHRCRPSWWILVKHDYVSAVYSHAFFTSTPASKRKDTVKTSLDKNNKYARRALSCPSRRENMKLLWDWEDSSDQTEWPSYQKQHWWEMQTEVPGIWSCWDTERKIDNWN